MLEITIEVIGIMSGGINYKFPRRDLGRGRFFIWFMLALALGIAYWMLEPPFGRFVMGFPALGSIFWVAFWSWVTFFVLRFPIWICLSLLFGHREVELRMDSLRAVERVGFLRRQRSWPLKKLKRLQIVNLIPLSLVQGSAAALSLVDGSAGTLVDHLYILTGILDDGKRIVIAPIYPRRLLAPFVEELMTQIANALEQSVTLEKTRVEDGSAFDDSALSNDQQRREIGPRDTETLTGVIAPPSSAEDGPVISAPSIGIDTLLAETAEALRKPGELDVFDQPPGSNVQVESHPDGIMLRIPPLGIWKGSAGLFQFGILWCVFIAGFTLIFLIATIAQGADAFGYLGFVVVMGFFWAVGGLMLYFGWSMGTRESAVAVVPESLIVIQTGLRRAKRREWPRREVKTVQVGPSGMEVNDVPVLELQIIGIKDKLFGLLGGRDHRELLWMATLLRYALKNTGPSRPREGVVGESETSLAAGEQVAANTPEIDIDYSGMTIHERLLVARLSDKFADAVRRQDRTTMLDLLLQVHLPEAGSKAYIDSVLADPKHYGY